jgi:hypothetical protein
MAVDNTVLCHPPGNKYPGEKIAEECLWRHDGRARLRQAPPVAYGANAVEALTGYAFRGKSSKTQGITEIRGSVLPLKRELSSPGRRWVIASIHPAAIIRNPSEGGQGMANLYPLLAVDAQRAKELCTPAVPRVKVHQKAETIADELKRRHGDAVSIDIEGREGNPIILGVAISSQIAHVIYWKDDPQGCLKLVSDIFQDPSRTPLFHNGAYDVTELVAAGAPRPERWYDTINMAALMDPDQKKRLESQVLAHVPGSTTWKLLVDHDDWSNPDIKAPQEIYRELWTTIMSRMGRKVPKTPLEWYLFYNGLDTAWTYALWQSLNTKLRTQGEHRAKYYEELMVPLQAVLLDMGEQGIPCDMARLEFHRRACERLERMAKKILDRAYAQVAQEEIEFWGGKVDQLTRERQAAKDRGDIGRLTEWPRQPDLTKAKTKLKRAEEIQKEGFNTDSSDQRRRLLYDYYGLPATSRGKTKGPSTSDDILEFRISQLERGTIKPKKGSKEEVLKVLRAMIAGKKWATWRRNFLSPQIKEKHDGH